MDSAALGGLCIVMLKDIVTNCLSWFAVIINATGLRTFWTGVVILTLLMSVVFVPMRSGQLLGGGAISTFAVNKISSGKRNRAQEERRNTPQLKYHYHHHVHTRNGGNK